MLNCKQISVEAIISNDDYPLKLKELVQEFRKSQTAKERKYITALWKLTKIIEYLFKNNIDLYLDDFQVLLTLFLRAIKKVEPSSQLRLTHNSLRKLLAEYERLNNDYQEHENCLSAKLLKDLSYFKIKNTLKPFDFKFEYSALKTILDSFFNYELFMSHSTEYSSNDELFFDHYYPIALVIKELYANNAELKEPLDNYFAEFSRTVLKD